MDELRVTGFLTVIGSKKLSSCDKEVLLNEGEGKKRYIKVTLIDSDGNLIVFSGPIHESKNGNLTAKFSTKIDKFEVVEY